MKQKGMKLCDIFAEIKQTYNINILFLTVRHICHVKVDQIWCFYY